MKHVKLFYIILLFLSAHMVHAQGGSTYFGESHRRYERFHWKFISSDNFDAYYYGENIQLAEISLVIAEQELKKLEDIVDYRLGSKSQILVFENDFDLRQSNLFQKAEPFNPGAYSYALENKVIAAFNGSRKDLKRSIRYGIGEILVNELMYGGSFQERFRSSTLLYMPAWFYKGLLSYLAEPWSTNTDDRVRDEVANNRFIQINKLSGDEAILAGHSWWNYVVTMHGIRSLSDLLYQTRASRGYESALTYVLGANSMKVFLDWSNYYKARYAEDPGQDPNRTSYLLDEKLDQRFFNHLKVSPNGRHVLLSGNYYGRLEVWMIDSDGKNPKRIYRSGDRQIRSWQDEEPAIAWNAKGNKIHIIAHEKGQLVHSIMDLQGAINHKEIIPDLGLVGYLDIHPESQALLLSASKNGQSDIYIWQEGILIPLTNDVYDDMHASFDLGGHAIYFSSNRGSSGMQQEKDLRFIPKDSTSFDIYSINYPELHHPMKRITHSDYVNEIKPIPYTDGGIAYLSDNNGIYNTYVSLVRRTVEKTLVFIYREDPNHISDTLIIHDALDSVHFTLDDLDLDPDYQKGIKSYRIQPVWTEHYYHYALSNNARNITLLGTDRFLQSEISLYRYMGHYYLQNVPVSEDVVADAKLTLVIPTVYRKMSGAQAFVIDSSGGNLIEKTELPVEEAITVTKADTNHRIHLYEFQTGFPDIPPSVSTMMKSRDKKLISYQTVPRDYHINFFPTYLVSKFPDNSIINTPYYINNPLSRNFNTFSRPNMNARVEAGIADLFNNHSIVAGGRIPLHLFSTDFYASYMNRTKKFDFGFNFFRTTRLIDSPDSSDRVFIHEIRPFFIFPLPNNFEFRFSPFARFDKLVRNATDQGKLESPDVLQNWVGARVEVIYDLYTEEELNFPVGTRAKVYFEHFQNITNESNSTSMMGMDLRFYRKLAPKFLWANRISGSASFGPSSVNYFVGGTENWLWNQYNALGTNPNYSYVFNTLISGIRGFPQNIRNGAQSLIINSEIRIPIVANLGITPVKLGFVRTLQWIAFYDIGSAWNGWNPFGEQHYNTRIVDQGSVRITVRNKNNPFVSGFGTGLRSRIFGYYIRADVAWGIENGELVNHGKPSWYFSFGYDF